MNMKLKVNDTVIVTGGKDKGKQGKIVRVIPKEDKVVVQGMNMYVKHIKPIQGRAGEKIRRERPMHTASVAILNSETGKVDRVGYKVVDGKKVRVYKKTGAEIK
jgi:large subunit ribosomal protein L24